MPNYSCSGRLQSRPRARFVKRPPSNTTRDPFKLLSSINDSGRQLTRQTAAFVLVAGYLAITAGSAKGPDLLINSKVKLPLLDATVSLWAFFVLAPLITFAVHFLLLLNDRELRNKVSALHLFPDLPSAIAALFVSPMPALGIISGRSKLTFIRAVAGLLKVVYPLVVLVVLQGRALAYHDSRIILIQRAFVLLDALLIMLFLWPRRLRRKLSVGSTPERTKGSIFLYIVGVVFPCIITAFVSLVILQLPDVARDCSDFRPVLTRALHWPQQNIAISDLQTGLANISSSDTSRVVRGRTFTNRDFACADLRGLVFDSDTFEGCSFAGANLTGAKFSNCHFRRSPRDGAKNKFNLSILQNSTFQSDLDAVSFLHADLRGATMANIRAVNTDFSFADLSDAELEWSDFSTSNFTGSTLESATAKGTSFDHCNLAGADMRHVDARCATFRSSTLTFVAAERGRFLGSDFSNANGLGMTLTRADLRAALGPRLVAANIQGALVASFVLTWETSDQVLSEHPPGFPQLSDFRGAQSRPLKRSALVNDIGAIYAASQGEKSAASKRTKEACEEQIDFPVSHRAVFLRDVAPINLTGERGCLFEPGFLARPANGSSSLNVVEIYSRAADVIVDEACRPGSEPILAGLAARITSADAPLEERLLKLVALKLSKRLDSCLRNSRLDSDLKEKMTSIVNWSTLPSFGQYGY